MPPASPPPTKVTASARPPICPQNGTPASVHSSEPFSGRNSYAMSGSALASTATCVVAPSVSENTSSVTGPSGSRPAISTGALRQSLPETVIARRWKAENGRRGVAVNSKLASGALMCGGMSGSRWKSCSVTCTSGLKACE